MNERSFIVKSYIYTTSREAEVDWFAWRASLTSLQLLDAPLESSRRREVDASMPVSKPALALRALPGRLPLPH